jgi:hypothetical protein
VPGYESFTQEIEFGRTNVARSPSSVFDQQLEEAIVRLSTADCVMRDAAGRLVTSTVVVAADGSISSSSAAIDSPLQNLAIYKQLMLTGYLGAESAPLTLPADPLDIAAVAIGAASDKTGKVSVDMLAYLNQILGLTDKSVTTFLDKKCIQVKEEVQGVVQEVEKCFLIYAEEGTPYGYNRGEHFGKLPSPAYIPAGAPQDGMTEYLGVLDDSLSPLTTFKIVQGPTLGLLPGNPDLTGSSIGGFAQAADDARAIIDYLHSWPLPSSYATPLTCGASGETNKYDVSISADSGLQVPVKMVAGTEGREFTLAIANAGPATASGTVELTAIDAKGVSITGFPRFYTFTTLDPGKSQSWTEGFSISYKTTVTWTATINAALDVNPNNNSVNEITTVIGKGGGSSGSK